MRILYQLLTISFLCISNNILPMMAALEKAAASETKNDTKSSSSDQKSEKTKKSKDDTKTTATDQAKLDNKSSGSSNNMMSALEQAAKGETKESAKTSTDTEKDSKTSNQAKEDSKTSTDKKKDDADTKPTLEISDISDTGLNTIDIESGGNWLEKRIWFKKGEESFDEIRTEVKKAADVRMDFINEVNAIGQKIDDFYEHVSFDKGQVDEMLKNILDEVSQASFKRGGDLSAKERSMKLSIQNEQKQIDQIGQDIKKVDDLDSQIDKTMTQAFKIVDECRSLETKAWTNFKAIGNELDDKKAKVLYYEIENAYKNIQQKIKHLQTTLLPYLKTKLIQPAEQTMTKIKTALQTLKEKGIHVESLIKGEGKHDEQIAVEREKEQEKSVEQKWEEQQEQKEKAVQKKEQLPKEQEKENTWYHRFVLELVGSLRCLFCWLLVNVQTVFNYIVCYLKIISCKIIDLAPGVFEGINTFLTRVGCCLKYVLCSFKEWICKLFA